MNQANKVEGRRVAVLAADGFEKVELAVPAAALRAAGAIVEVISLRRGKIRGLHLYEPTGRLVVDATVHDASPSAYDALFVPGGFISPDLLRQSAAAREWARSFDDEAKPIATICHGPWLFASAGVLRDRVVTSWPGIRDDVVNAGATWIDRDVVRDGNLVTSRSPHDLAAFVEAMLQLFGEHSPIAFLGPQPTCSDPAHDAPPENVLTAFRSAPRASLRTALAIGTLAAGVAVARARQRHLAARLVPRLRSS